MGAVPFVDKAGRVYKYGEYFPIEMSHVAYNDSFAQELEPLTKEEVVARGYNWKDHKEKNFNITLSVADIPDDINEVEESILEQVLECAHKGECAQECNTAFKITNFELSFYKKNSIPLPVLCPNCRYYERIKVMPALALWHRSCMNVGCNNEFETAYAPDRPEKIYCESCYNKEVY